MQPCNVFNATWNKFFSSTMLDLILKQILFYIFRKPLFEIFPSLMNKYNSPNHLILVLAMLPMALPPKNILLRIALFSEKCKKIFGGNAIGNTSQALATLWTLTR